MRHHSPAAGLKGDVWTIQEGEEKKKSPRKVIPKASWDRQDTAPVRLVP